MTAKSRKPRIPKPAHPQQRREPLPWCRPKSSSEDSAAPAMLERILPPTARYFVATVEAMPSDLDVSFLAVDEIQLCADPERDGSLICVVEEVDDLWALERSGLFKGRYHVLGGTLSALDGLGPEELGIDRLLGRLERERIAEVILATSATVDGQTTAHYIAERLAASSPVISRLAHGVPIGGELNYLDDGTLGAALKARRPIQRGPVEPA